MKIVKVLTLDLSTKSTGYAIGTDKLETSGQIKSNYKNVIQRIIKMREQIKTLIKNYNIEKIIMEQVRPDFNIHTNKVLMWLQATVIISAYEINNKIEYDFLNPSEWRAIVKIKQGRGIYRETLKAEDIQYVKDTYNLIVNDDEADAICLFDAYNLKNDNEINWE